MLWIKNRKTYRIHRTLFGATSMPVFLRTILAYCLLEIEFEFFFESTEVRCVAAGLSIDLVLSPIGVISI
jgi:hypothetical protein